MSLGLQPLEDCPGSFEIFLVVLQDVAHNLVAQGGILGLDRPDVLDDRPVQEPFMFPLFPVFLLNTGRQKS